jgi:2'-5' RNA ligase
MNALVGHTRRLFFALWPDPEVRRQLVRISHQCTRRPVADANLHMTLVFLGARTEEEQQCFCQAVSSIHCEPFEIEMDYLGGRARSGIQWLAASRIPEVLLEFVSRLNAALETCGYQPEPRRFLPHVTLARKVKKPLIKSGLDPIHWPVRDFVLVESLPVEGGVRYEVLERWPFEKPA